MKLTQTTEETKVRVFKKNLQCTGSPDASKCTHTLASHVPLKMASALATVCDVLNEASSQHEILDYTSEKLK